MLGDKLERARVNAGDSPYCFHDAAQMYRRNADRISRRVKAILALATGIPLELVQRVTGHRTVEVVMKHYLC